jgi:Isochorismatase family
MSNIDEAAAMSGSAGPARGSEEAGQVLPDAGFVFDRAGAALVVIDPQNDFLSPDGAGWPVFGQSVTENKVVANLARLFEAAESSGMTVAISPHYEYPADRQWRFGGPGERLLNALHRLADRLRQLPFHRRRKGNLPHPARGRITSRGAARSDSAAAMSAGTGTFEPWKP